MKKAIEFGLRSRTYARLTVGTTQRLGYIEWFDIIKDQFGQTTLTKRSTMVYELIKSVIHKIEKERARKELELNNKQKEVFQRWKNV